jgi:hypothetical protein
MEFVIVLAVLAIVVVVVSAPFRRAQREPAPDAGARQGDPGKLADLEAAREAKYREIRDAELDHRTGKLSDEDFAAVDGTLRAEAIEILDALESEHGDASSAEG